MTIVVIGAMEKEVTDLIEKLKLKKLENCLFNIYQGTYNNKTIILSQSGIGKVNSAINTQYLIDKFKPSYIINTGCAGSLTDDLKIFDIIIGKYTTYHDFNPERIMKISTPNNGLVPASSKLTKILEDILIKSSTSYLSGTIATGDSYVTDNKMRDEIKIKTNALAVDMESCSIAHTAKLNNVPFLIIRTISDFSDGSQNFEEKASNISSKLVIEIISKID